MNGLTGQKERRAGAMAPHGDSSRLDAKRSGLQIDGRPARRIRRIHDVTAADAIDCDQRHQQRPGHVDDKIPLRSGDSLQRVAGREISEENSIRIVIRKFRASLRPGVIVVMVMMAVPGAVRMMVSMSQVDMVPAVMMVLAGQSCMRVRHRLPHQAKRNQQESDDAGHTTVIG